jgi:hypothetical protein
MACQTIIGHFALHVAIHAPFHCHLHPWPYRRSFTLSDIAMAILTIQLSKNDMTAMRKEDMIRLFIYPLPRDFFILLLKFPDFFLFWALRDGVFMAFQAVSDAGYPGEDLGFEEAVACVTLQPLFTMFFMIERDGLLGLGT